MAKKKAAKKTAKSFEESLWETGLLNFHCAIYIDLAT